jgi:hypothetical protein
MTADKESPTPRVVEQRIRNRIIEILELASSFERQHKYQSAQVCHVPNELLNQWWDWVDLSRGEPGPPVYSAEEVAAIRRYDGVLNAVADSTPPWLPDLEQLVSTASWRRLRDEAAAALVVFLVRGRFSEDQEQAL